MSSVVPQEKASSLTAKRYSVIGAALAGVGAGGSGERLRTFKEKLDMLLAETSLGILNSTSIDGHSLLQQAISQRSMNEAMRATVVEMLLKARADPEVGDISGRRPLHRACMMRAG